MFLLFLVHFLFFCRRDIGWTGKKINKSYDNGKLNMRTQAKKTAVMAKGACKQAQGIDRASSLPGFQLRASVQTTETSHTSY